VFEFVYHLSARSQSSSSYHLKNTKEYIFYWVSTEALAAYSHTLGHEWVRNHYEDICEKLPNAVGRMI
jgi:hypothetical protein